MALAGEEKLFRVALGHLKYRPRSEQEIQERLRRAGGSLEQAQRLIGRLKATGAIDDAAFARFWTESRRATNPKSRRLLELELRRKGVQPDHIAQAVASLSDEDMALQAAQKGQRRLADQDFSRFVATVGGYLQRRGFSYEISQRTARRVWEEKHQQGTNITPQGATEGLQ